MGVAPAPLSLFIDRRNIRGQDFSGMHCAILTVKLDPFLTFLLSFHPATADVTLCLTIFFLYRSSTVVSVGILRIFGQEMAELPLAATRVDNQDRVCFSLLFDLSRTVGVGLWRKKNY